MKTVKQIADEIGVSKQAIYKKIKSEPLSTGLQPFLSTENGKLTVTDDGEKLIKWAFLEAVPSTKQSTVNTENSQPVDSKNGAEVEGRASIISVLQATIDTLQGQLQVKDIQLSEKDRQIAELNTRMAEISSALVTAQQTAQAAQALHAGTIKQQLSSGGETPGEQPQKKRKWWWGR